MGSSFKMAAPDVYTNFLFYSLNLALFWMKHEDLIIDFIAVCMIFVGFIIFFVLLYVPAPYGRYSSRKWGFGLAVRYSWIVQECPSFFMPVILVIYRVYYRDDILPLPNLIGTMMVAMHYFQRSFIYPLLIEGGKPTPFIPCLLAFVFCNGNGYIQGQTLVTYQRFPDGYLMTPAAIIGLLMFTVGMGINCHSDYILRNLRRPGETGYKMPRGGAFELVSGANFLGEMIEWTGYAFYCWNLPAFAFAFFTYANLIPRALKHHRFYVEKFDDYPKNRKAIFPYLL